MEILRPSSPEQACSACVVLRPSILSDWGATIQWDPKMPCVNNSRTKVEAVTALVCAADRMAGS